MVDLIYSQQNPVFMSFLVPKIAQKSPNGSQVTGQNVDWESSAF